MATELASTHSALLIADLLSVHALASMYRASGRDEYFKAAADWLPNLDNHMANLRRELTKPAGRAALSEGER